MNSRCGFREKSSSKNPTPSFPTLHPSVSVSQKKLYLIGITNKPSYLIEAFKIGGKPPLYYFPVAKEYLREMDDLLLMKDDDAFAKWVWKKQNIQALRVCVRKISSQYAEGGMRKILIYLLSMPSFVNPGFIANIGLAALHRDQSTMERSGYSRCSYSLYWPFCGGIIFHP